MAMGAIAEVFQFTPLREGRPAAMQPKKWQHKYFNSRPCVRGDLILSASSARAEDFNSRPCVRGDTTKLTA